MTDEQIEILFEFLRHMHQVEENRHEELISAINDLKCVVILGFFGAWVVGIFIFMKMVFN